VHFTGGQGTGREHLARVVHSQGADRARTFVPLDCRRLPPFELKRALRRALIHEPGDDGDSPGGLPGTLFLRNVAHLPRDLQELVVASHAGAVRLMASSTDSLTDALEADELIPEFYYLVTELTIDVPSLHQRREDLPLLAQQLLEQQNRGGERQVGGFTPDVLEQFARYNWPGNVAELAAVVAEARAAGAGALITPQDLPFRFRTGIDAQAIGPAVEARPIDLEAALAEVEREHILRALQQAKNNKSQAAALLGLTRPKLYRRMEVLGLVDPGSGRGVQERE
jgi:DNA-binding NtrC family response regulator